MTIENRTHTVTLEVREYECDQLQGVNNSVYLNYLEHARYEYIGKLLGWDLKDLVEKNIGFVLRRLEIDFKRSLESRDVFSIESTMQRIDLTNFRFLQDIYLLPGGDGNRRTVVNAIAVCTAINIKTGRAECSPDLESLLIDYPLNPL